MWLHPEIRTLPDIASYWAARAPEKIAVQAGSSSLSYADLADVTDRVAAALTSHEHGRPPTSVAFIGKNVPEFWAAWLGAGRAGRAFVPLNWRCTVHELVELINDAEPGVVFVDAEYHDMMQQVVEALDRPVELVDFDSVASGGAGLEPWLGSATTADEQAALPVVHPEDIALIAYTSGTTGRPKGVMIRHEAFDLFALSDDLEPTISWSSDDVALMVMPNFHLAGSWVSLPALYHGGTVVMLPAFDPGAVLQAVEQHRPTVMCLVPTAIAALLSDERTPNTDLSSLRTLIYAGSPIAASTIDQAVSLLGGELRQFYGTSETYIITILRPEDHVSTDPALDGIKASCGPVPLVSVRIVDPGGRDLPDGEVGEVIVRSPMAMAGYYRKPEETAKALRDGWYWTGDLGYRTASGHHFLVDRAKDMIVTGGENVYSVEVERALQRHPRIAMVAVVGTPHERWGEAVTAYVVAHPGEATDGLAEELISHCREYIASYKVPKIIHIEQALPMTPMGKVRKVDLRRRAVSEPVHQSEGA